METEKAAREYLLSVLNKTYKEPTRDNLMEFKNALARFKMDIMVGNDNY